MSNEDTSRSMGDSDSQTVWSVLRLDDNGVEFVMASKLTRPEADALAKKYEARGHKQTYWISKK